MADIYRRQAAEIVKEIIPLIKKGKREYAGVCMIMAPIFTPENQGEGYIQRVKAIDQEILCKTLNIYIDFETQNPAPTLTVVDSRHILITLMPHSPACAKAAVKIAKRVNLVYTHSVMRAMADIIGKDIHRLYTAKGIFRIWDVHGSVPEEFALSGNYYEAQNAGEAEELFVKNSNIIITVNRAMEHHLEKKYHVKLNNTVVLPIFNTQKTDAQQIMAQKASGRKPVAVYAGGLQEWQNIPLMQATMKNAPNRYIYKMFVQKPEEFKQLWGKEPLPPDCEIAFKSPKEVQQNYTACHFGFVLRDDITVNNVACPTKLTEYLQYGIVPVLKSEKIGDFAALGMEYIHYSDFAQKDTSFDLYLKMAQKNFEVLEKLFDFHRSGSKKLKDILHEKFNF